MFNKLLITGCFLLGVIASKAEDGPKISSKVQKVIVFLTGAQVTRTATANINAGTSTLVFGNLSPDIDVQSIQVRATGNFTVLSVKRELDYLDDENRKKRIADLQEQQNALREKQQLLADLNNIYRQEESMLEKNQVINGPNTNLDVLKLKQALDFQTARLTDLKKKEQGVNDQVRQLSREILKYSKQIAEAGQGISTSSSNLLVTVLAEKPENGQFTISYVVNNAGWFPTYDIRAKNVNSPITIAYKANVSQKSGEDWKNIKLTLSTGNPSVSGNKPDLKPYYLNTNMIYSPEAGSITRVTGRVTGRDDHQPLVGVSVKVKGSSIGTVTDASGQYSLQIPLGNPVLTYAYIGYQTIERPITSTDINVEMAPLTQSLNEVVVVGYGSTMKQSHTGAVAMIRGESTPLIVKQMENQTNIEFNIDQPYTIPSDGKQYTVEINQTVVAANYQYAVVPKVNTDVFLTASITNWNKYNFLSGEANLFFEGTFMGKSLIDVNTAADTLNFSLGTDKNIVVTRTLQKELTQRQSIGSTKKETRDWLIEVKNHKNQPVNLLVEDQIPVSQNTAIDVEKQELSGAELDEATGKVNWKLQLQPQADKKVHLKYLVKYPKNQLVVVQ
jgi:hypothetical protein